MHQMDTGHKGTLTEVTHDGIEDRIEEVEKKVEEGDTISSPERLSEEVTKVLSDMNDIVMGIHHIMDEDEGDLDSLIQEYTMVDKEDSVVAVSYTHLTLPTKA